VGGIHDELAVAVDEQDGLVAGSVSRESGPQQIIELVVLDDNRISECSRLEAVRRDRIRASVAELLQQLSALFVERRIQVATLGEQPLKLRSDEWTRHLVEIR
jgi:hypothetical protein